jgi:phospholipid/cholesterol/gamma-HCH transport system ATP-binding protein
VILLRNVSLRLKGAWVLRNVSLEIPPNNVFALIGPGASGKSVLFKVITGLLRPDSGEVFVDNEPLAGLNDVELAPIRAKIGMLFQNYALFDHMTVYENIAFPLRRMFSLSEDQIAQVVHDRLQRVSLPGFHDRYPPGLSGGQKKRVGIARATAQRAPIILYDEPTAGLDPVNSQKIYDLVRDEQRAQGTTAVVISSDVGGLLTVTDHVAMLHRGECIFSGTTAQAQRSGIAAVNQFVHGLTEGPL